jgi:thiamine-phosphate pyrophosphorylase
VRGIYIVTDESISPGRNHLEIAQAAVAGYACCVQLREKNKPSRELYEIACAIRATTVGSNTLFIVNDRVDIAAAAHADGVHIGRQDLPLSAAREIMGPEAIIGVSIANVEEALEAEAGGADYVAVSPVFQTATKADAGIGLGLSTVSEVKKAVKIPVAAIGGISLENVASVAMAGADSAAVISAVVCADDMVQAIRSLSQEFEVGIHGIPLEER